MRSIHDCNETHPLNRLAAECLGGYSWNNHSTLAILVLIEAHWDSLSTAEILNQKGGPTVADMESTLSNLSSIDPDRAMCYLTKIGDSYTLDVTHLKTLDGVDIANEVLETVVSQLMLGVELH